MHTVSTIFAAIQYIVHLELLRNSYFFFSFSVGEGGNVTSGIALNCLHSENSLYGRLATESSNDLCVKFAVKEESLCVFWEEIWSTAFWE